jgi:hypothetical protein
VTEKIELEGRGVVELPTVLIPPMRPLPTLAEVIDKKWPSGTKFTAVDGKVYVLKLPVRIWKDAAAKPRAKRQTAAAVPTAAPVAPLAANARG